MTMMRFGNQQFVMRHDSTRLQLTADPPPMVRPQGTMSERSLSAGVGFPALKVTVLLVGARFSMNRNGW